MSKPYVLIVEDNPINALVLGKIIEDFCQVIKVENDEQTFVAVEKYPFSLILMDINLGGNSLDGEAIMKMLRKDFGKETLPIFAVTSYALPEDRERFLASGFDNYFAKPIAREEIIPVVKKVLGQMGNY
ncbi:MAG: response regulator [Bacteroidia bacterium]|nr:response regulator [Bacteroidia bacterium]